MKKTVSKSQYVYHKMLFQNNLKQCKPTLMSHNSCFGLGKRIDNNIHVINQVYNAYETFLN